MVNQQRLYPSTRGNAYYREQQGHILASAAMFNPHQNLHDPANFADEDFLEYLPEETDDFIDLFVRGVPKDQAVIRAFQLIKRGFGTTNADMLALAILSIPSIAKQIDAKIKAAKPDELWHARLAAHKLLQIVQDDRNRESARLNAIAQLNVLLGITEMTETGQQKLVDKSLADFYTRRIERQFGAAPSEGAITH
ncbi:hypothetical protein [Paraburkholderia sp. D1E]|uniref:hypothetical protein n=1 Tax=Paraburkholderia sp. D1E TaxID=3461398 RepID=UPI0040451F59